ncbi:MAG: T9SS type A sorting domain-containing protein [Calditrichaeota bacterium]|nr:T9SS type A sorting domain-containing protein [Calditrichota bacterium]
MFKIQGFLRGALYLIIVSMLLPGIVGAVSISGSLLDVDGNLIEEPILVEISHDEREWNGMTTENGHYQFDVEADSYILRAGSAPEGTWYYQVYYPNIMDVDEAEWVDVFNDIADVNFTLHAGGKFSGSVTPAEGGEFDQFAVSGQVMDENGNYFDVLYTFSLETPNDYTSIPVPPGMYTVRFATSPPDMHAATFYNGQEMTIIEVTEREILPDIDLALPLGGGITGSVSGDGTPLPGSYMYVYVLTDSPMSMYLPYTFGFVDGEGNFALYGLPVGDAYLQIYPSDPRYPGQFYGGVSELIDATAVPINSGEMTPDVNIDVELGANFFGTIRDPEGNFLPGDDFGVRAIDKNGGSLHGSVNYDPEDGTWRTRYALTPGPHTLRFVPEYGGNFFQMNYIGGVNFAWEAEWFNLGVGDEIGPIDINFTWGGSISGTLTDPDGNPVPDQQVIVAIDGIEYQDENTNNDGDYQFSNLPPGIYTAYTEFEYHEEMEWDDGQIWPTIYSGNVTDQADAAEIEVVAQQDTEMNLQFVRGGAIEYTFEGQELGVGLFGSNLSYVAMPFTEAGQQVSNYPTYPDESPFEAADYRRVLLPVGNYKMLTMPLYAHFNQDEEAENHRYVYYGGGFSLNGADVIEVVAGQVTTIEMPVAEGGWTVSGSATTEGDLISQGTTIILIDASGQFSGAHANFFSYDREGGFYIKGVQDGTYHMFATVDQDGFLLSTWYPDIEDPGQNIDDGYTIPEGAETIVVNGGDVEDLFLEIQTVMDFVSVPLEEDGQATANEFTLHGAYPNPFNSMTRLFFSLTTNTKIDLKLYDIRGREVMDISQSWYPAGNHTVALMPEGLAGGVYFARMKAGNTEQTRKVVLMK